MRETWGWIICAAINLIFYFNTAESRNLLVVVLTIALGPAVTLLIILYEVCRLLEWLASINF